MSRGNGDGGSFTQRQKTQRRQVGCRVGRAAREAHPRIVPNRSRVKSWIQVRTAGISKSVMATFRGSRLWSFGDLSEIIGS